MSLCALSCDDLLGYNQATTATWRDWFAANEAALSVPCDIMNTGSVRLLVQHIFAVELRYAQQLAGQEPTAYADLPSESVAELFSIHDRALAIYPELFAAADEKWMDEVIEIKTRSLGAFHVSRRTVVLHAMLHSVRHWAQLATLVRQAGFPGIGWQDYLIYGAVK